MENMITLGTAFKPEMWVLTILVTFIVCGFILKGGFNLDLDEAGFWIWNVLFTAMIVLIVWGITVLAADGDYKYIGTLEEKEIHNIVYNGKNQDGRYIIKFSYEDGSVSEVAEKKILCINGTSRVINYATEVDTWLYYKVRSEDLLALNYNDYINVVGNMDDLLSSENVMMLIKDRNLSIPGINSESNMIVNKENNENVEVDKNSEVEHIAGAENNSMITELKNTIDMKDKLIQTYSEKISTLESESEEKDKEINKKDLEIDRLKNKNKVEFKSTDFINICIGLGILALVGMGVFLMIVYTKHKLAKIEMTLKSELKIREGVMLDKDIK